MGKSRASAFSDVEEDDIDLSGFAPKAALAPSLPTQQQVKAVSEANRFPSREGVKSKPAEPRKPRRHRTGRNIQFNAKASNETVNRFYAISDSQDWVLGYTLERAVEALERELKATS